MRGVALAVALCAALVLAGCGAAPSGSPSGGPATPRASASASASPSPSPSVEPATPSPLEPSPSPSGSAAAIAWDASLLEVLPATIAGLAVEPMPEAVADVEGDVALTRAADRIAFALVLEPESGELAVASVVALRDGVYGDAFFRAFRDSYDEGACGQAGGVIGNAEAELGGRTVAITSCDGGARTYHAYLPNHDAVVSITAVGEELRLGEALIAAVTD